MQKFAKGNPDTVYWITIIASIILFLIIYYLINYIIALVTICALGAYIIVKGFSLFSGNFPDELYVNALMEHREYNQAIAMVSGNLFSIATIVILFLIGFLYQIKDVDDDELKEKVDGGSKK